MKNKLYQYLRKWMLSLVTMGMILTSMTLLPVQALTGKLLVDTSVGWNMGGTSYGIEGVMTINGDNVYCLQRKVTYHANTTYTAYEDDFDRVGIDHDTKVKLSLLAYFGKQRALSSSNKDWYAIVQSAIWAELEGGTSKGWIESKTFNSEAKVKDAIKTLNEDVTNYYKLPSFAKKTYNLNVGEKVRLEDSNKVLNTYRIAETSGLDVSIDGNTLVVTGTADSKDNATITFIKNIAAKDMGVSILYDAGSSVQKIGCFRVGDPTGSNVKFNVQKYGSIILKKTDNRGNNVSSTSFKVSYNSDMSESIGTYTTGSDGTVKIDNLLPKTIYYQEISTPDHLVIDNSIKTATINANQTTNVTVTNNWKQGFIQVTKKDADTNKAVKKAGTVFDVYNSNNQKITSISTNQEGIATSSLLDYGTYYVKESQAPDGYVIKVEVSEKVGVVENNKIYSIMVSNKRVTGTINLSKEDSITGKKPLGEATLQGAIYGLYAKENIVDPSDEETIFYRKDALVSKMTTDENGNASLSNLYLGKYYLKEIASPYGYTLDTNTYELTLDYENQNTSIITKNQTVLERVKSQSFSLIKISNEGESGETTLLKGAEFTIKSKKDIDKYGSFEDAPIAKNAQGQSASVMVTDSKGYAVSDRLPIGEYSVRETKVPLGKYPVRDFTVIISEDSDTPLGYRVFNDASFKSILKVVKKDSETHKTVQVAGAQFKIKNLDTNEYFGYWNWNILDGFYTNTWTTNEQGFIQTAEVLPIGHYQLEEIASPQGYLLSKTPIEFIISPQAVYETLADGKTPVISVEFADVSVKGQITVEKHGEVLVGYDQEKDLFQYEERMLKGMKVNIYAREDILDPSNDGTVLFKAGTLIDTITTGDNGKATSKKLPLGKYSIEEIQAPEGFVLNKEKQDIELKYKDETTAVVLETSSFINQRQKVEAKILKVDSNDKTVGLSGAIFSLVAHDDIYDEDGHLLVKKGQAIASQTSNEEGYIDFSYLDLPLNHTFSFKETKAPIGYVLNSHPIEFNTNYQDQSKETIVISKTQTNTITQFDVSKKDITNDEEISNAFLMVYPKDEPGAIYDSWMSGSDGTNEDGTFKPHRIIGLEVGKTYVLKEISSPHGYVIANEVEFTVKDTGEIQSVEMKDEMVFGQLQWNKTGEIFNQTVTGQTEFGTTTSPIWNKSNLLGAEITIYAAEDITIGNHTYYKENEAVETLESDLDTVISKKLPVGHYYYKETKVPHGYIIDTDKHFFEIEDNQINELQKIDSTLINTRAKVNLDMTKVLEEQKIFNNKDAYKDIIFGIFAREDIYDYMGDVQIEHDSMIYTSGIDHDGHLLLTDTFDLPHGVYYIKELATNPQYVLNDKEYDFEIAYHGQDVSEYTVQIGRVGKIDNELARGSIQVIKKDSDDEDKILKDVSFNISTNEDMKDILSTSKTNDQGIALFDELELGTYYIQEAKQVDGYVINDHIYKVEVTKDGDLLAITCMNKPTQMEFSKQDFTTSNELPGAHIKVTDKETGEVIDEWISTDKPHIIKYLVEGKQYIMTETIAPYGYHKAKDILFIARDGKSITMRDEAIYTDLIVKKVDSQSNEVIKSQDFIFGLYLDKECTQLVKMIHGNKQTGTAIFKNLRYGTYYVKEMKAPLGYQLSNEVKEIIIDHSANKEMIYTCYNSLNVQTNDTTSFINECILLGMSMLCFIVLKKKSI